MPDSWSLLEQLAGFAIFALIVGGAWGLNIWLGFVLPLRKAKAALVPLTGPLGLTLGGRAETLWPASRKQFTWTDWPLARGSRGEFRVEVQVQPGARWLSALTYVHVAGPRSAGGHLTVTRQSEMLTYKQTAFLVPWLPRPAKTSTTPGAQAAMDFLGEVAIFGDAAQVPRLFTPAIRAQLQSLPRHLISVGFDGSVMQLSWAGVEQDPAIVERAFQIAASCLQALSASSAR